MDVLLLGWIGAMVVGAAIVAVLLSRKGRRSGSSSGARGRGLHDWSSSTDTAPPTVDSPVYLAHHASDAAESPGGHAAQESHSHHSSLDSLVEAAGVSLPDASPAPSSDSGASFSSSFDSGSSFSSSDSGSSSSSGGD